MNISKKALKLADLVKAFREVHKGGDISEYVPAEYADYEAKWRIEDEAYRAGREAERDVPRPDYLAIYEAAGLKEYVALQRRLNEVQDALAPIKKALETLESFRPNWGFSELYRIPGFATSAEVMSNALRGDKVYVALLAEESALKARIEPKERKGSRQDRILKEAYEKYRQAQEEARRQASEAVLAANAETIRRGKDAERAMTKRIAERRDVIVRQMREVFNG